MRTIKPVETESSRAQAFPPCVICGRRHNWHECQARKRAERGKRAPQRGGDPASLVDVLLANKDLPADLRERLAKRKEREEKADG